MGYEILTNTILISNSTDTNLKSQSEDLGWFHYKYKYNEKKN